MAVKNYYSILGVKQNDSVDTIRKAYRNLAKKYHPDLNPGDATAEVKMQEIGEAWETLGDENKRGQHDRELAETTSARQKPFTAGPAKANPSRPMTQADFNNLMGGFDSYLSRDSIKRSVEEKKRRENPIDTTSMFEQFMGFRGPKKK